MRLDDWTWRNEQRHDDLQFVNLSPRSEWPVGSQEYLLLLYWGKQEVGRRFGAEDRCDPLEMGGGGEAAGGVLLQNS